MPNKPATSSGYLEIGLGMNSHFDHRIVGVRFVELEQCLLEPARKPLQFGQWTGPR
ncbi:MAG TPA: hypothetical protein VN281_12430 [Verrucomicrobiae bacterium]|nr:hypothetical protein [Verrucomicrobiae bacterium]